MRFCSSALYTASPDISLPPKAQSPSRFLREYIVPGRTIKPRYLLTQHLPIATLLPSMPLQHTTITIDNKVAQYSKPNSVEDILQSPQVEATRQGWKRSVLAGSKPNKAHNQYILYTMFTNGSSMARQHYWKYVATPAEKTLFKDASLILADEREVEAKKISPTAPSHIPSKLRRAVKKSGAPRVDNQTTKNINSPNRSVLHATHSLLHALDAAILANSSSNLSTNDASLLDPSTSLNAHTGPTMILDGLPDQNLPTLDLAARWYHGGGQSMSGSFPQSQSCGVYPKRSQDYHYPHGSGNDNPLTFSSLAASYTSPNTAHTAVPDLAFAPKPETGAGVILNDFGFPSPTRCFDNRDGFDSATTSSQNYQTGSPTRLEAGGCW